MLKHSQKVAEYELPIKIESQKTGGFVVSCPAWKDCYAQGDTIEEAILEITAVAQSLIELYKEEGFKIPLQVGKDQKVDKPLSVPVVVTA